MKDQQITVATEPINLLALAIQSNADIDKLERLVALQERWEQKEAQKAFSEAMRGFQAEKPVLIKDSGVSHDQGKTIKYTFKTLGSIQQAVDPVLSKFGLSYSWRQERVGELIKITCIVRHVSGHSEETALDAKIDTSGGKNEIQGTGSTVSYLKRYTLENALGLSSVKDVDGISMSVEEQADTLLNQLKSLVADKAAKVKPEMKDRLDQIVRNKETHSYKKAIETLNAL